jgi:dihydrofolate reductase
MTENQRQQQEYLKRLQEEMAKRQQGQQRAYAEQQQARERAQERQQMIDNDPHYKYAVIAAVDLDRGFSKAGEIPWHYPADLKWFKQITSGHICVMGKTTYEDINKRLGEKAKDSVLPDRKCFVVSSILKQEDIVNATVIQNIYNVVNLLTDDDVDKTIFFIGGKRVFQEGISLADTVYLTAVNETFGCDKFFPVEYIDKYFTLDTMHKAATAPNLRFLTFVRK